MERNKAHGSVGGVFGFFVGLFLFLFSTEKSPTESYSPFSNVVKALC